MINEILDLCYKKIDIIKKSNLNENNKLKELSKLNNLIDNLKVKGCFSNMGITLGVSVLSYLGIKDEELVDTYLKLVDYETKEEETEFKIIY